MYKVGNLESYSKEVDKMEEEKQRKLDLNQWLESNSYDESMGKLIKLVSKEYKNAEQESDNYILKKVKEMIEIVQNISFENDFDFEQFFRKHVKIDQFNYSSLEYNRSYFFYLDEEPLCHFFIKFLYEDFSFNIEKMEVFNECLFDNQLIKLASKW